MSCTNTLAWPITRFVDGFDLQPNTTLTLYEGFCAGSRLRSAPEELGNLMNYRNPVTRFLLRKDFSKRVRTRLFLWHRKIVKDEVADLACLLQQNPPKVIFDVGANVGFMTWQLIRAFPSATVFAFEPDPTPLRVLEQTHGRNPRIRIFPIAAADREGELPFLQRDISCNSSLLEADRLTDVASRNSIQVKAETLDHFCARQSILHIELLKTDTEGADLLVLKGARGLLAAGGVDVVMSEVLFAPTYKGQATFDEIAGYLKNFGFLIYNIYIGRETGIGQACYANVIFIGQHFQQNVSTRR